ncbi:YbaK/EbsC family protein [Phreatobacter cathodiphilus]|uniref:Prolyl-tRNA editing protein n=1 Tax=Phreatobacter cathodiphilus TaxID=1868589 RepID=A0A2S0N6U9_9HYPH|nr:YbaK/EbsC family protein [Phreatobacter cathodiphilus]AVO43880.1 prolyl-tRNA editing protein [Phreatobacter cathodiphilus]
MAGSTDRVRGALRDAGHDDTIVTFPASTRTAAEAAAAVGCAVAQIAKSLVFRAGDRPVLVIASGTNRVDTGKVADLVGAAVERPDVRWVRDVTGFAIGGVAPVGHLTAPIVLVDADLAAIDPIWAAAGAPNAVFRTRFSDLLALSGGTVAAIAE